MTQERGTVRAVAWQQLFPSLRLLSALRLALNFKVLVLAAIAVAGTAAGWRALGQGFADPENAELTAQIAMFENWPWQEPVAAPGVERLTSLETWRQQSPLVFAWHKIAAPFRMMYEAQSFLSFMFLFCCALWALVVWAFFGGCISRQAAVAFARHENVSLGRLVAFTGPRLGAYFVAPLFPILGTFLMAAFMAVLGLVMRNDVGLVAAAIVWPLVLLGGFMMAFLLVGLFFGFPLMWGCISTEGTDAFGALSHSYSYVYQRPLHYLVYGVLAAALGVLGWYLVSWFVEWIMVLSTWGVSWGSGEARIKQIIEPSSLSRLGDTGVAIITFWDNCLRTLAIGFIFSYFWSATTVIYFLLRRLVDATELDEIFMTEAHEKHGLPPLKTGPDGMPMPADIAAAGEER